MWILQNKKKTVPIFLSTIHTKPDNYIDICILLLDFRTL